MKFERAAGILLHPTSLPGPDGIGDLGPKAYSWLEFLQRTGTGLWQVLPLNPTGYGDSPYQSFSAFAGNHYLISSELLIKDGLLLEGDLEDKPDFPVGKVEFGAVIPWKIELLEKAYGQFKASGKFNDEFDAFVKEQGAWLDNYALFMALKDAFGGKPWVEWPASIRDRQPEAIAQASRQYAELVERQSFWQFLFFKQWVALREQAHDYGIKIIGDVPIYVSHDSADVWANRGLFYLEEDGKLIVQAGVPPDYFSKTGQLWGNPIYRWDVHAEQGFAWWIKRMEAVLKTVDIVRMDHFRGFAGYWEVPASAPTAETGQWVAGPGAGLFHALRDSLGELPLIAEDLGEITPDVIELRDQFDLPGMKIFQFSFDGNPNNPFLTKNYSENCVAYTGSHDNETVLSWFEHSNEKERSNALDYLDSDGIEFNWDLIEELWNSRADMVVAQMQDFLSLGDEARMNLPGKLGGNWEWQMKPDAITTAIETRLKKLNMSTDRHI